MKCLVTGAYGFIGRDVVAALQSEGVSVVGAGRDLALGRRILPDIEWIACDFNRDIEVANWLPRLAGIDAVVNSVGILQSSLHDDAERIHGSATIALFQACAALGVRRLVHISAVSADRDLGTAYAQSKAAADRALAGLDINWLIVKPSLVIGRGSYGGPRCSGALPASLHIAAAWAGDRALPADRLGRSRPRHREAGGVRRVGAHHAACAGPQALSVRDIIVAYRAWLGFPKARAIVVPLALLRPLLRLGDAAGLLGFASALRTTSLAQMRHDTLVDGSAFANACGVKLKSFKATLQAWPATLQDRLHARSYFIVPLLQVTLALFWILTGVMTLTPRSFDAAVSLVEAGGFGHGIAAALVGVASIVDIILGILFLLPRFVRPAGAAQLAVSAFYLIGLSMIAPGLWTDHFGPLLKVVPMMAATGLVMAFQEKR